MREIEVGFMLQLNNPFLLSDLAASQSKESKSHEVIEVWIKVARVLSYSCPIKQVQILKAFIVKWASNTVGGDMSGTVVYLTVMSRNLLDMVENLLAVAVVLVEPAHHLIGRHQVGGAEGFPQSRLEDKWQTLPFICGIASTVLETFFCKLLTSALFLW